MDNQHYRAMSGANHQQQQQGRHQHQDASRAAAVPSSAALNQADPASFPPLVRPAPSYPHAYANILNPRPDHAYRPQPAFFDHRQQQHPDSALPFTVDPNEISAWDPNSLNLSAHPGIQQYAFSDSSDPHHGVIAQGPSHTMQHRGPPSPSSIPFPPPSHPSQHASQPSFSPHVFSNQLSVPHPTSRPASQSASPSPGPGRHHYPAGPKHQARMPHPASNNNNLSEPADAPWNLVPYSLPFTGRNRGSPGGMAGPPTGSVPGATGNSLFLRSPTPTKRQRTNQACEKCRDRKAKCNGGRPTCQRCASRGLPCEYAKERRMRGPNRTGNGHSADGDAPHNRTASSPARTNQQHHPQVSVHISTGQGTSPPPNGGASPAGRPSPPPPGSSHPRKMLESWPQGARGPGQQSVPIYRTVHVAHSHPDLHLEFGGPPSLVSANGQQPPSIPFSRPRSHTTPHPLVVNVPTHPSPLYNTIRSTTEFSSGENSEPPSATSSHFPLDAQPIYNPGGEAARGPDMYGVEGMAIDPHMGMLGLSNDGSIDTVHAAPQTAVGSNFQAGQDAFSTFSDSPDSYKRLDFNDDPNSASGEIGTNQWPASFSLNVNTTGLGGHGAFSVGTQSASASSNPSTSSPGPVSFRSHISQHSGSSLQDTMGWNGATSHFASNNQPGMDNSFPHMPIDSPSINFPHISPKIEPDTTPFNDGSISGLPSHYNYPWSSVDAVVESNGSSFPRVNLDRGEGLSQSPETDFRTWFADSEPGDGGVPRKASSGDGSSAPAVDAAANGKVRSVAVLEVRD